MKGIKLTVLSLTVFIFGVALLIINSIYTDESWIAAIGAGCIGFGLSRIIRLIRNKLIPGYAKKAEIADKDERIIYISEKAKSLSFSISIVILAITGIILKAVHLTPYSYICFYFVCGICLIYAVAYFILSRKY